VAFIPLIVSSSNFATCQEEGLKPSVLARLLGQRLEVEFFVSKFFLTLALQSPKFFF
jgi:Na+/H+ antiporter NhaC